MVRVMWNTFDKCREELEKSNYSNGQTSGNYEKIRQGMNDIIKKYSNAPFSSLKARVIEYLLE